MPWRRAPTTDRSSIVGAQRRLEAHLFARTKQSVTDGSLASWSFFDVATTSTPIRLADNNREAHTAPAPPIDSKSLWWHARTRERAVQDKEGSQSGKPAVWLIVHGLLRHFDSGFKNFPGGSDAKPNTEKRKSPLRRLLVNPNHRPRIEFQHRLRLQFSPVRLCVLYSCGTFPDRICAPFFSASRVRDRLTYRSRKTSESQFTSFLLCEQVVKDPRP